MDCAHEYSESGVVMCAMDDQKCIGYDICDLFIDAEEY